MNKLSTRTRSIVLLALGATGCTVASSSYAINQAMLDKGYVVATDYPNVFNQPASSSCLATDPDSTAGLQAAIDDARSKNLALYLPTGTYCISDTLKAYSSTISQQFTKPIKTNPVVIIGASAVGARPLIKLKQGTAGFADPATPKVVLAFRNFKSKDFVENVLVSGVLVNEEKPNAGYHQMLRNVNIDCSGSHGCVGLYFNQAQDSTIENVKINATDAHTGIYGLPGRAAGAVNIEVVGGKYGIDTTRWPNVAEAGHVGSVIAGLKLSGQTISAIHHVGSALTVVGFEIISGAGVPAMTTGDLKVGAYKPQERPANSGVLSLIDGTITVTTSGQVAVSNMNERSIHLRNVYITGSDNLIKSPTGTITATGSAWKRVNEYQYTNTRDPILTPSVERKTFNLINGYKENSEYRDIVQLTSAPSADYFVTKHIWNSLPAADDSNIDYDTSKPPATETIKIKPGVVSHVDFQYIIDRYRKIYLQAGVYKLTGTVTLKSDTILYGAARNLTRIEVDDSFSTVACPGINTTCDIPVITTADEPNATTYIGDLSIGVPSNVQSRDYFTALDWRAGRHSMVHIGRIYHNPEGDLTTNAHNLLKISGNGGGRWYFLSRGQAMGMNNAGYRILKVDRTSQQPLWIYGLNMEHAASDSYAEFVDAQNIRIYSIKTETGNYYNPTTGTVTDYNKTNFLSFRNASNVALFGHAQITASPDPGYSNIKFTGTSSGVLAALVIPSESRNNGTQPVVSVEGASPTSSINHPDGLGLFKQGLITPQMEATMVHADIGYAQYRQLALTVSNVDSGTVSGNGSYVHGVTGQVSARPAPGWKFDGWTGPNAAECSQGTVLMNSNKSCTANFSLISTYTGFKKPAGNSAVSFAGDGNGYESPGFDPAVIADKASGTSTSTSCTNLGKDKHDFFNHGLAIPVATVVQGVEVRLRARSDSTKGNPVICVQLSSDGGSTWTPAKMTGALATTHALYSIGGASDVWGATWQNVVDYTKLRVRLTNVAGNTSSNFYLYPNSVQVQLTYKPKP